MENKVVLLVNDDGIDAPGIIQLAEAAKDLGEVWVVCPDRQNSAMSHRITYNTPLTVTKRTDFMEGINAYACSGSPADCVRVGVKLIGKRPDLVLSGVNYGYNISWDLQYSGTVSAALEAAFLGVNSIALSQANPEYHPVTDRYLKELIVEYMDRKLDKKQCWNINFPDCPPEECKGVMRDVRVSDDNFYCDDYSVEQIDENTAEYKVIAGRNWKGSEGTDLYAVTNNFVSVGVVKNIS
ncbi:MAG: 5'/3'-nucleotidase SurE [Clostridia bacterium]|nr:5'/3'-nucleotidase SurE [Clostridia bacterium]